MSKKINVIFVKDDDNLKEVLADIIKSYPNTVLLCHDGNGQKTPDAMNELATSGRLITTFYDQHELETNVTKIIKELGIYPFIKGYGFLQDALIMAVNNPNLLDTITKDLYPLVASHFNTKVECVERNIRLAITRAWEHGNKQMLNSLFCYAIDKGRKPTNLEFIAVIVDKIRQEYLYDEKDECRTH